MSTPRTCIVIDVEATCWQDKAPNTIEPYLRENEIIEFGITIIDMAKREILESESIIVRPTTSEISEFCTELTTLTPEFVEENGVSFIEALDIIKDKYKPHRNMWGSWGCYDRDAIYRQCQKEHVKSPFNNNYINIKSMWCWEHGFSCGVQKALNYANIKFEGTPHRGVDDSFNTAKLLLTL